jgi:hypothetical protein
MADFTRKMTALAVIQQATGEMGLPIPATANGSTDLMTMQLWSLLIQAGQELLDDPYKWQCLVAEQTLTTIPGTVQYDLPLDWAGYYDNSSWNNSSVNPVVGSLTSQMWRLLKARNLGSNTFILQYMLRGDKLELYSSPSVAQTLKIDYMSRGWVQDASSSTTFRDYPASDSDLIRYNPRLIISKLKLLWRIAKGFDTTGAQNEYEAAYARAKGTDTPGLTINLAPVAGFPYIGYYNIPDTGYGS